MVRITRIKSSKCNVGKLSRWFQSFSWLCSPRFSSLEGKVWVSLYVAWDTFSLLFLHVPCSQYNTVHCSLKMLLLERKIELRWWLRLSRMHLLSETFLVWIHFKFDFAIDPWIGLGKYFLDWLFMHQASRANRLVFTARIIQFESDVASIGIIQDSYMLMKWWLAADSFVPSIIFLRSFSDVSTICTSLPYSLMRID